MPRLLRSLGLVCTVASFPTLIEAQESPEREVALASARFDSAFAAGDFETQAALLADEAVVMSAGGTTIGREGILARYRALMERRPGVTLATLPDTIEIGPEGWNVASERGTWIERWMEDGEQVDLRGSYQAMWRLVDGRWLLSAVLRVPIRCVGPYCQ